MVIRISGNGRKEALLRALLTQKGHTVREVQPDVWVLPLPFSSVEKSEWGALNVGAKIVMGIADEKTEEALRERGLAIYRILEDEAYTERNTLLSAEGALCAAMEMTDGALTGANCLVIGNGRLGTALCGMLKGLGARVTVAARRKTALGEAPLEALESLLTGCGFVFNTVPFPVLHSAVLRNASKDTCFLELASAPYGIDREAAAALGLRYSLESGIPGRYCPAAAARNIADYLERSVLSDE